MEPLQGPKMKRHSHSPAVLLAAILIVAAWPAFPGGRDVPDTQNSEANQTSDRSAQLPASCDDSGIEVSVGTVRYELSTDSSGQPVLRPAVFRDIRRLMALLFGSPRLSGSCPER